MRAYGCVRVYAPAVGSSGDEVRLAGAAGSQLTDDAVRLWGVLGDGHGAAAGAAQVQIGQASRLVTFAGVVLDVLEGGLGRVEGAGIL